MLTPSGRCIKDITDGFPAMGPFRLPYSSANRSVLTLIPDDFTVWLGRRSELMTFHDIRAYTRRRHQQGSQAARLKTDYHRRIAVPLRHRDHGPGRHCAEPAPEWHQRGGSMAMGIGQALARRLLLLDGTLDRDRARPRRGLDAADRRLDGERALYEFWSLFDAQGEILTLL